MKRSGFKETSDIETSSEGYAQRFSGKIGEYFLDVQTCISLDFLKSYPEAKILDVGGGHAQITAPLVHKGFNVTVTGSADICRNRLDRFLPTDSFTYYTCDILNLPFNDNEFDVVMAFRLLPHVEQWKNLISELCRVSRSMVIVDYPDIRSFNFLYKMLFNIKKAVEVNTRPFRLFNRREVAKEFVRHGFNEPIYKPEFFCPMVIHRVLKSVLLSRSLEWIFHWLGLTYFFGSPVILKVTRVKR